MSPPDLVLAIDQGTTGSTAILVDDALTVRGRANVEFPQHYPRPAWVEHQPEEIWASVQASVARALREAGVDASRIRAIGITNQRETTVVWERASSRPIHPAIVWQCRRTTEVCRSLKDTGVEPRVREKTGLVLDPYFSGTKVAWILDHVDGARARAERGELAFGTIDSFLVSRLGGGAPHVIDVTNASRTLLMDLAEREWNAGMCDLLRVPASVLPKIVPSAGEVARTRAVPGLPDGIPIAGMAGDQQAALFGQACFAVGDAKCTYGTGAFILMNTGGEPVPSRSGLITTVAWRLGDGELAYALEGSAFIAGAAVQWLRDGLGLISSASEIEALARSVPDSGGVVVVPAFAGLGAPYWRAEARGVITGLTRGTTKAHLARATLEGVALQNVDILRAMERDSGRALRVLKVDGGAAANDLLMQYQSDVLGVSISRPALVETTALGAAFLAGLGAGMWTSKDAIRRTWREQARFEPAAERGWVTQHLARWAAAIEKA